MTLDLDKQETRILRRMLRNHKLECKEALGWTFSEKEGREGLKAIRSIRRKVKKAQR